MMEDWNNGIKEYWSGGVMEIYDSVLFLNPRLRLKTRLLLCLGLLSFSLALNLFFDFF